MSTEEEDRQRHAASEAICTRCGICCHQKVRFGDVVVITDIPCEFLDTATNTCTVYPHRFVRQPLCATAEVSVASGTLPDDCPYVGGKSDYCPPLLLSEHPEYQQAVDALFPEGAAPRSRPLAKAKMRSAQPRAGRGRRKPL
jgi:Uncharacterized conserved protein